MTSGLSAPISSKNTERRCRAPTSPRLRGEVARIALAMRAGEGDSELAPHVDGAQLSQLGELKTSATLEVLSGGGSPSPGAQGGADLSPQAGRGWTSLVAPLCQAR